MYNNNRKELKIYALRKTISLSFLSVLIICIFMALMIFFNNEKKNNRIALQQSNDLLVNQVASFYEVFLTNAINIITSANLYNKDIFYIEKEDKDSYSSIMKITSYLNSVITTNDYYHSMYLYYSEDNMVYSSFQNNPTQIKKFENFFDKDFLQKNTAKLPYLQIKSRDIPTQNIYKENDYLNVITLLYKFNINNKQTVSILLNIDMNKLYSKIFNTIKGINNQNLEFSIINNNNIIFNSENDIKSNIDKQNKIQSSCYSSILDYTFNLSYDYVEIENFPFVILLIILILIIFFIIFIYSIYTAAKPFKELTLIAKNAKWKEILQTDFKNVDEKIKKAIIDQKFNNSANFCILNIWIPQTADDNTLSLIIEFLTLSDKYKYITIKMSNNNIAIVFASNEKIIFEELYETSIKLLDYISDKTEKKIKASLSAITEFNKLSMEYSNTIDLLEFRLCNNIKIITQDFISPQSKQYPSAIIADFISSIMEANKRKAEININNLCSFIFNIQNQLRIVDIENILYKINEKLISLQQINNKDNIFTLPNLENFQTGEELSTELISFYFRIIENIETHKTNIKNDRNQKIILYINNNYKDSKLNLNYLSSVFEETKSNISKIIRKQTGKNFNDYLTEIRIKESKELLKNSDLNINEIAYHVGFSYPYYYIRKFKEIESLTPGQYKEALKN